MTRRAVRNPDLLHAHAAVTASKAAAKKDALPAPLGAAEALDELQNKLRLDPRTYVLTDLIRAALKPPARKELSQHDLKVVKEAVKSCMSGGYRQVYMWFGEGAREHWADSIALGIVTAREGVVDTDWVHQLKLAVYREIGLETVDVATPLRMSDLTKKATP